ncbi:4-amino-4-deoxychorismate lyase [Halobacteriales archaeon QS_3_64_16]|nr:MAG: 4-amino-4-deoxychorismate lyase [Halobacteriales archaeon QS_3_64_16]
MYYHVNGEVVPAEEATVSVRDRGFLYGDAAFETLRAYGGAVFEPEAHLERLRDTCESLGMEKAVPADLSERIAETLAANDLAEAYVRVSVTRGTQPGKLTPQPEVSPSVVVIVDSLPRGGREGSSAWDGPATVATVETRAIPDAAIPAGTKTHNYLNGILARLELRDSESDMSANGTSQPDGSSVPVSTDTDQEHRSADEALLREESGAITEGATSNVFFVTDGVLRTPSAECPLLPGITRSVVLDLAASEGIPTDTGSYTRAECRAAEELFLTNTTWELRPVTRLDDREIPAGDGENEGEGGPITRQLANAFDALVERRHY